MSLVIDLAKLSIKSDDKPKQSRGMNLIENTLKELRVVYSKEVTYSLCSAKRLLPFDVQVTVRGVIGLIEYDGSQHFKCSILYNKTKEELEAQQSRDLTKTLFAKKHSISLLRIAYNTPDFKVRDLLVEFLTSLNNKKVPVYMFSSELLYKEHKLIK